jgi:GGDEF domain-containing protein
MNRLGLRNVSSDSFLNKVDIELKRAERYRFFVSIIALDLSFTRSLFGEHSTEIVGNVLRTVQTNIRIIDDVSVIGEHRLVLLLPETSRQGAEMAAKRLSDLIRSSLSRHAEKEIDEIIPLEMVSYPDAAGAKTIEDFLQELSRSSSN